MSSRMIYSPWSMMSRCLSVLLAILLNVSVAQAADEARLDPTRPLSYGSQIGEDEPLKLNSVLISGGRKVAIINGVRVREQQLIEGTGGVRVTKILPYEVLLQQGKKSWRLSLKTGAVKRHLRQ